MAPHKSQLSSIRIGLDNWKLIWNRRSLNDDERFFDVPIATLKQQQQQQQHNSNATEKRHAHQHQHIPTDEPSMWKRSGFWRHAPEYWLLARLGLDRSEFSSLSSSKTDGGRDDDDGDGDDQHPHEDMSMLRIKEMIGSFQRARVTPAENHHVVR